MTNRESEILEIIKKQPDIEQSEIASRLNIARASGCGAYIQPSEKGVYQRADIPRKRF